MTLLLSSHSNRSPLLLTTSSSALIKLHVGFPSNKGSGNPSYCMHKKYNMLDLPQLSQPPEQQQRPQQPCPDEEAGTRDATGATETALPLLQEVGVAVSCASLDSSMSSPLGLRHSQATMWLCPHCSYRNSDPYHRTICAICGLSPAAAKQDDSCSVHTDPHPQRETMHPPRIVAFDQDHNNNNNNADDDLVSLPSLPSSASARSLWGSVSLYSSCGGGGSSSGLAAAAARSTCTESVCSRTTKHASNTARAHFFRTTGRGGAKSIPTTTTSSQDDPSTRQQQQQQPPTLQVQLPLPLPLNSNRRRREQTEQAGGTLQPPSVLHDSGVFHLAMLTDGVDNDNDDDDDQDDGTVTSLDSVSTCRRGNGSMGGASASSSSTGISSSHTCSTRRNIPHEDPLEEEDQPRRHALTLMTAVPSMTTARPGRNPLPQPCSPVRPLRRMQHECLPCAPPPPHLKPVPMSANGVVDYTPEYRHLARQPHELQGRVVSPDIYHHEPDQSHWLHHPLQLRQEEGEEEDISDKDEEGVSPPAMPPPAPSSRTHKSVVSRVVKKFMFRRKKSKASKPQQNNHPRPIETKVMPVQVVTVVTVTRVEEQTHPAGSSTSSCNEEQHGSDGDDVENHEDGEKGAFPLLIGQQSVATAAAACEPVDLASMAAEDDGLSQYNHSLVWV